ncbi:glycosyltransferase involved in cell wall biosynthesis [Lysobacter niastensis]|uniref:Glycosyltransferase involved in cell wall biosynthesis n=1 Tax=Lysobacter niastensis TaxID=380629 RepID=A0ABU1WBW7_9GAMM|nr:glycosyltransferase family 4 protein [Lysobacter niastensis]MDR7135108.1 glycosyltransferase involved in cell wall biosynthesis [Lysobacter niastensis]
MLMVSSTYPIDLSDWRGLFIRHMVDALARRDDVALRLWSPPGDVPASVSYAATTDEERWLRRLMAEGGIAHLVRRSGLRGVVAAMQLLRALRGVYRRNADIDVFHVNWLQNALPLPRDAQPLLVTVLGSDMQLLRLPGMRTLLRRAFRGRPVVICPNADWMLPELEAAFGDLATVRLVSFGIDPRWYALERSFETNATPKWLCVSRLTANKIGPLFDWTAPLFANGRAELHLFGPMQEQLALPSWVHWHGPASPEVLCESWFPQAHGLITLSQHAEGRPQVMLEALASGLPIVASRLPAHDDLLAGGDGGVLCDSPEAVQAALDALANPAANRALGLRGRARMQADMGTWNDCAERYMSLYRHLQEQAHR